MQIDYNILITYGGVAKNIIRAKLFFMKVGCPIFLSAVEGSVKVFSTNIAADAGIVSCGESFGEPPLLGKPYPSTAQARLMLL